MNIQKFFILLIKVILLLSVIIIFSYVNTIKAHREKQKLNKKIKEGLFMAGSGGPKLDVSEESKLDMTVDEIVKKTQKLLKLRSKDDSANMDMVQRAQESIIRNGDEPDPNIEIEDMSNYREGFKEGIGYSEEEQAEKDAEIEARREKARARKEKLKNQKCRVKGKTIVWAIQKFFETILFIFIWLGKAMWGLLDAKQKEKPKNFFETLLSPFNIIFYMIGKMFKLLGYIGNKCVSVFIMIITTITNIIFVFFPSFFIEILAYFFSPIVVAWRSFKKTSFFSPFGAVCWDDKKE